MTSQDLVRQVSDVGLGDRPVVGGKGASLGELSRAGMRVPAGYVVTVRAFERGMLALDPAGAIRSEIERLPAGDDAVIARVTARVRSRIAAAPLPDDVQVAIRAGYRRLRAGGMPRSRSAQARPARTAPRPASPACRTPTCGSAARRR